MKRVIVMSLVVGAAALMGWTLASYQPRMHSDASVVGSRCIDDTLEQVWVPGGSFMMGDDTTYREEGPAHRVTLDGFWIDAHEVTNRQFAQFVEATGYVTVAERVPDADDFPGVPADMLKPGSATFTPPTMGQRISNWWSYTPGADWKHPQGPDSSIDGKANYPVVHVAFEDAKAYADWAGRALPTEAQYEFAARSKKDHQVFPWGGTELSPGNQHRANTWQGIFPVQNSGEDGYEGIAPVGCYQPNDYGAYDLIGNVWEWTTNHYAPRHDAQDNINPQGPSAEMSYDRRNAGFPVRVIKGGSYLCAPNYCMRYRPAARHAQDTGLGTGHIGFRTVLNQHTD